VHETVCTSDKLRQDGERPSILFSVALRLTTRINTTPEEQARIKGNGT